MIHIERNCSFNSFLPVFSIVPSVQEPSLWKKIIVEEKICFRMKLFLGSRCYLVNGNIEINSTAEETNDGPRGETAVSVREHEIAQRLNSC